MAATTTEYRAAHWGTATVGWIPLGGLTRKTQAECEEAVYLHEKEWHDGPFRITKVTITEEVVSTYPS